jgi:hypothetical protein
VALLVVSYPKSGRTWLRVMLDDIGLKVRFSHDGSDHYLRRHLIDLNPDKGKKYPSATVLLMVRDPRDTVVSGYFQVTRRLKLAAGTLSDFIRDDRHGINKICRFNLQWFAAGHQVGRFAILSYENMHDSAKTALIAVAEFAGTTLSLDVAERISDDRAFARMQAAEVNGELAKRYGEYLRPGDPGDAESFKVRRGIVGGYGDYLSDTDISYCDDVLSKTDYWPSCSAAISRWGVTKSVQIAPTRKD